MSDTSHLNPLTSSESFAMWFKVTQMKVHANAREKGFWDKPRNDGECLMLMVSELVEGFEALRKGDNTPDDKIPEFKGIEAELADTVIRIMDYAEGNNLQVADAINAKIEMNRTREHMHGGKKF